MIILNKNHIGMIEIKGPNVFKGYLNKSKKPKKHLLKMDILLQEILVILMMMVISIYLEEIKI